MKRNVFGFRRSLSHKYYVIFSSSSFVLVAIIWSILAYGKMVDPFFLPAPGTIALTIWEQFTEFNLLADIWASVFRIISAFALSAALAIPIGIFMSSYRFVEAIAEPPVDFVRYLPVPALVPLTILWVGIGEESKILLLFIGTFFQLVLLVMDDANNVPRQYVELAYTLGGNNREVIKRVIIPAMLPSLYDDLRVTLGWCWTYLLIGELVAARTGLGHMIKQAQRFAKPEVVISGILIIGVIGLMSDYLFKLGHRFFFRYLRK